MPLYKRLLELKKRGQSNLILVIAPPRTGSTLLSTVISKSNDVNNFINDPQNHEGLYKQLFEYFLKMNGQKKTVLIKEMSHWIYPNKEYKKIFSLADKVVISIRNPLLSTESRIRKFLEALNIKFSLSTYNWMVKEINNEAPHKKDLESQCNLLDLFARKRGFKNWKEILTYSCSVQNYNYFDKLLFSDNTPTGFSIRQLGWKDLSSEFKYLLKIKKTILVVDSTDLRSNPEFVTKSFCNLLGISFDKRMIEGWKNEEFENLITEKKKEDRTVQSLWYDTISTSSKINPPTEKVAKISSFPKSIQTYLRNTAIPIYQKIYKSKFRISVSGN